MFGGRSGEHEVSIQSAKSIMAALDPARYEVVPIGITRAGNWVIGPQAVARLEAEARIALGASVSVDAAPSDEEAPLPSSHLSEAEAPHPATIPLDTDGEGWVRAIDVVFPALHGSYGEDGTIQGLLEVLDVPYVGAGVLASAAGMDKVVMKKLFAAAGLPQVEYTFYRRRDIEQDMDTVVQDIGERLGYPCFVKPANLGSSVGISKVKRAEDLPRALQIAARYDRKVIVERGLDVREVEVAVLGNDEPQASLPGEIVPSNEFYDYRAKYVDGQSALIIPANLSPEITQEVRRLAVEAFKAIDCSGLARVDFFIERGTNRVLVNEINTMPGFTAFSMYPKLWEATGIPYSELLDRLIQLALERYEDKRRTEIDFRLDEE
jgi:D-alanine-D-alanine ligase